jgi:hypothetical protein
MWPRWHEKSGDRLSRRWPGEIKPVRENPSYIDEVSFLVSAKWDCDSEAAIERKARDILELLAKAVQQLPTTEPCIVHFGIEALDGDKVEAARLDRIRRVLRVLGRTVHFYTLSPVARACPFGEKRGEQPYFTMIRESEKFGYEKRYSRLFPSGSATSKNPQKTGQISFGDLR